MSSGLTLNGKELFDSDWIGSSDLGGRDLTVEIEKVERAEVFNRETNKKTVKLALRFKGQQKGMICNRTNATMIATALAQVLGRDTDGKSLATKAERWVGQKITLYPTTCMAFGETKTCVRVRERTSSNGAPHPATTHSTPQPAQPPNNELTAAFTAMKATWKEQRELHGMSVDAEQFGVFVEQATGGAVPAANALSVPRYTKELIDKCVESIREIMPVPF